MIDDIICFPKYFTKKISMKYTYAATVLLLASSFASAAPLFGRHAVFRQIKSQIQKRPAISHGIVGFVLFGASDAFAQQIETSQALVKEGKKESPAEPLSNFSIENFDTIRFLSAGAIGTFFGGFVYPFAYKQLDRIWKGNDLLSIAKKSLLEIVTVGVFANSISMGARGILVGKNPYQVVSHVKDEMPEVTLNDFRVWFPYNMLAFGMIPVYIRPATTSLMECLWQTYISLRSNDYTATLTRTTKQQPFKASTVSS